MSRIVIDARESGTSTGRYIDKLIENLHTLKPDHEFIILTTKKRLGFIRSIAPSFTVIESPFKEFTFGEQIGFAKQLYGLRADLVHFGMTQQPILYFKKSVTTMHDLTILRFRDPSKNPIVFKIRQLVYKFVVWWAAHKSSLIITDTEFVKKDISSYTHVNTNKFVVTYLSADKIASKPIPMNTLKNKEFVLYVGRPGAHKNLDRLVEAFAKLKITHPKLYLVLVGKSDPRYKLLEQKVTEAKIEDVVFTGFIPDDQLRWLYEHALAYVFPSLSEGFGLPGLEAMQYDLPVVSSNATCLSEVYQDAALYFDPTRINEISAKVDQVLTNPKLAKQLAKKGRELLKTYSWEKMAQETLEVYNSALN